MCAAFNAFRLRPGVIKMETCDKFQDEDGVEKNVKVMTRSLTRSTFQRMPRPLQGMQFQKTPTFRTRLRLQ